MPDMIPTNLLGQSERTGGLSCVWGLTSKFFTTVVPSESAAMSSMRFDSDFEPGSLTWPSILVIGCSTICSFVRSANSMPSCVIPNKYPPGDCLETETLGGVTCMHSVLVHLQLQQLLVWIEISPSLADVAPARPVALVGSSFGSLSCETKCIQCIGS